MKSRRRVSLLTLPALLGLSGCGYVHVGRLPEPVTTVIGDDRLMQENSELRLEKKMLQQELALTRAQGEALKMAIESRAADGDTSRRLVEKLNETSKELAALRASYAQLQSGRGGLAGGGADVAALQAKLGETEDKLARSLRGYTELQDEIARLKSDVAQSRTENLALSEQVRVVTAQNEQAQAALALLNRDLLAQKQARVRAEQDADVLRSELKTVAPNSSALAGQRTGAAADARSLAEEHAAEKDSLRQQLASLQARVEALTAERATLTQQLSARVPAADLANLEAQLATARRSESLLRDENSQLKATRAELARQLAQAKAAPAGAAGTDVREQLRQAEAQVASLSEENARLKARLTQAGGGAPGSGDPVPAAPVIVPAAITVSPNANGITVRPSGVTATLVAAVPKAERTTAAATAEAAAAGRVHVVASGDTLAKISTQYYGTPGRWSDILAANRDVLGENNNLIIGRTLRIP